MKSWHKMTFFAMIFTLSMVAHADTSNENTADIKIYGNEIHHAAQQISTLYNSDFVMFLSNQHPNKDMTLGKLAQTCINYTKHNANITRDTCEDLLNKIAKYINTPQEPTDDSEFTIITTNDTTSFSFDIYAAGNFTVDCGNGRGIQNINKTNTDKQTIKCDYSTREPHTIKLGGTATKYSGNADTTPNTIGFRENANIKKIEGCLGCIFPTLSDDIQPDFYTTFYDCANLEGPIPDKLFNGIYGEPIMYMFAYTFADCKKLNGPIPPELFSGISGTPADAMFLGTFANCKSLNGSIPQTLFSNINGQPAPSMFAYTFYGCKNLAGPIPDNLFANIRGTPAEAMFMGTFAGCENLSGSIPQTLFSGISGAPAKSMFWGTFAYCENLTGSLPALFSHINGAPAPSMYKQTFDSCTNLTGEIPRNLFGTLNGDAMQGMFEYTFMNDANLTGTSLQTLHDRWPGATELHVGDMYHGATGLSDYETIPNAWK